MDWTTSKVDTYTWSGPFKNYSLELLHFGESRFDGKRRPGSAEYRREVIGGLAGELMSDVVKKVTLCITSSRQSETSDCRRMNVAVPLGTPVAQLGRITFS